MLAMGCTVSGVERKNYECFVWNQEKSKTSNDREHVSLCGEGHRRSPLKRSTDLGKILILRTTDSGRNFVAKKIKNSPRIKAPSNSSDINTRVALPNEQNKGLRGCDSIQMKGNVFGFRPATSEVKEVV